MPSLQINSQRLYEDFLSLSEIGKSDDDGVTRVALSNEDLAARSWFANRIEEAGLLFKDDEVANLSGILPSKRDDARTFMIGSHLDTVPNGGRYDGSIGVLAALECLRTIQEAGLELPLHLEVIDFTDEEGTWQSLFGSMGIAGMLEPYHINDAISDNALFRATLFRAGLNPNEVYKAKRVAESIAGYLELHVEQGCQLDRRHKSIGLVTNIVGRSTLHFRFIGEASHAGTTPPEDRHDALLGASGFVLQMHQQIPELFPGSAVNCGNLIVEPGAINVIPAQVSVWVECRHPNEDTIAEIEIAINDMAKEHAVRHGLHVGMQRTLHRHAAEMDSNIRRCVVSVCEELGIEYDPIISYAGHDAQIMSEITPSGMIFIPSVNGMSHNPGEFTEWEHVVQGANVLLQTVLKICQNEC